MAIQIAILVVYIFSSAPHGVIIPVSVSVLLTAHFIVGSVQPDWYVAKKFTAGNTIPAAVLTAIIWITAYAKL